MKKLNYQVYALKAGKAGTKDDNNLYIDGEIEGGKIKSISSIELYDGLQLIDDCGAKFISKNETLSTTDDKFGSKTYYFTNDIEKDKILGIYINVVVYKLGDVICFNGMSMVKLNTTSDGFVFIGILDDSIFFSSQGNSSANLPENYILTGYVVLKD